MDGDDRQKKTTCADDKLPELNLPGCDPQTVQQTREQRTAQFIQNNCPVSLEYIEHSVSMQLHLSECHRGRCPIIFLYYHHHHHAFGSYWSIGRLQELSRHSDPGPASQVVPTCNPFSLFQPPDRSALCFLGGLVFSFPVGSRSGLDV